MERGIAEAVVQDVMAMSELVADAVAKRLAPITDDLSQREARKMYGHTWLDAMTREGKAHPHPIGGRLIYSRHELDTLRAVEREYAKMIVRK